MPPVGRPGVQRRRLPVNRAMQNERDMREFLTSVDGDLSEDRNRIEVLERLRRASAGCCPGEWIIPELTSPWELVDEACPFMYRWGPYDHEDLTVTVDDAGIEFSGHVQGGVSGDPIMTFPEEDRFSCDKLFPMIVFDDPDYFAAASTIIAATGVLTPFWPLS